MQFRSELRHAEEIASSIDEEKPLQVAGLDVARALDLERQPEQILSIPLPAYTAGRDLPSRCTKPRLSVRIGGGTLST